MSIIKSVIWRSGYTEEDIMWKMGVSEQTIKDWVNGTSIPTIDELFDLAALLKLDFRELAFSLGYTSLELESFYGMRNIKIHCEDPGMEM